LKGGEKEMTSIQSFVPSIANSLTEAAVPGSMGLVTGDQQETAKLFQMLLAQVQTNLSTTGEAVASSEAKLEETVTDLISQLQSLLPKLETEETNESNVQVNEEELLNLLDQLMNLFEMSDDLPQKEAIHEEAFALFTQLPAILGFNPETKNLNAQADRSEGSANQGQQTISLGQVLEKWQQLIKSFDLSQEMKTSESKQIQEIVQSLNKLWNKDSEWKQFLTVQVQKELNVEQITVQNNKSNRNTPAFSSFVPLSLLGKEVVAEKIKGEQQKLEATLPLQDSSINNSKVGTPFIMNQEALVKETGAQIIPGSTPASTPATEQEPTVRMGQLLQDLKEVFKTHFQQLKNSDTTEIRIKLAPEHLGHLDIKVISENGKISAVVMAGSKLAKEAIELQIGQLRMALVQQGIQVDKIEVSQPNQSNQPFYQDSKNGQQQFAEQRNQNGSSKVMEEEDISFENELETEQNENDRINLVV